MSLGIADTKKKEAPWASSKVLLFEGTVWSVRDNTFFPPSHFILPWNNAKCQAFSDKKVKFFFSIFLEAAFCLGFWL